MGNHGGMPGELHVQVRTAYDAECAEEGGADRLVLVGSDPELTPPPEAIAKIRRASSLDLRVRLRTRPGYLTDGADMSRLKGMVSTFIQGGADGFVFGFLNAMSGIDIPACAELAGDDTWGWTFDRAIDAVLDQGGAWSDIQALPRLDSVMTAGSARDVEHGLDNLLARAGRANPPLVAAGGLEPGHVPWLVRGGITAFYVDSPALTPGKVRAWRRLIDEEIALDAVRRSG